MVRDGRGKRGCHGNLHGPVSGDELGDKETKEEFGQT